MLGGVLPYYCCCFIVHKIAEIEKFEQNMHRTNWLNGLNRKIILNLRNRVCVCVCVKQKRFIRNCVAAVELI